MDAAHFGAVAVVACMQDFLQGASVSERVPGAAAQQVGTGLGSVAGLQPASWPLSSGLSTTVSSETQVITLRLPLPMTCWDRLARMSHKESPASAAERSQCDSPAA